MRYSLRRLRDALGLAALLLCAAPDPGVADVLTGTVATKVRPGVVAAPAVVYAEPVAGAVPPAPGKPFTIAQKNKTFSPRVLAVPVGATVQFPNDDAIFHNVFSLTPGHAFDLGLYRAGASKSRTITTPGVVRVFCNIHPQMTALIVAVATPWIATPDANGAWRLDVPAGRYRVTALSERAPPVTVEVTVAGTVSAAPLTLDESTFVAAPHTNKFGKPYAEAAYKQP
jgi:plastocyanin